MAHRSRPAAPTPESPPALAGPGDDEAHGRVGPYRLLRVLGEGGMGIVYEAEELGPVRRRVALKLIKPGFASRASTARIEVERQALAVMSHPAIATVFSAGASEEGQPYFAMELVSGSPLLEYCDSRRLNVRERLELFLEICHGVQHAHQKGVIHRDLKPSNVLVVEQDGRPQPKIIDFGIAKALGQQLTDSTLVTQQGQAIGTAAYMSPEQAGAEGLDVDTRADIYSLGVILYELLAGELPVSPSSLGMYVFIASLALGQLSPPPPSVRLRENQNAQLIAHARRSEPQRLVREIGGDLDTIVMKAIEPDRTRRYETVSALAVDVQRYLGNEPILARPPSTGYRLRKFVQRHRTGAIAGSLAAAALVLGSAGATVGMVRATAAERSAAREAAAAQQVTNVLVDMFEVADPFGGVGPDVSAREILDRGAVRVRRQLASQPQLYGRVLHTMGKLYGALADYDRAEAMLHEALSIRERQFGPMHPELLETLSELGGMALDREDLENAERYYSRALAIAERSPASDPMRLSQPLMGLAGVRVRHGRYEAADSLYARARAVHVTAGRPVPTNLIASQGALYYYQGRLAEAEPLMVQVLRAEERLYGPEHPHVAGTLNNLGVVYFALGRYADALPLYERAAAILERRLGSSHPYYATALTNIGEVHWKLRRYAEAETFFRRSLAITLPVKSEESSVVATTLHGLAGVLRDTRRYAEAEPLYQEAVSIRERSDDPGRLAETLRDYAELLRATGRTQQADALVARAERLR